MRYDTPALRWLAVLAQVALWLAAIVITARVRVPGGRRSLLPVDDETLIDLTGEPVSSAFDPILARASGDDRDLLSDEHTGEHREVPS